MHAPSPLRHADARPSHPSRSVLGLLTRRPTWGRHWSATVVLLVVSVIGFIDSLCGPDVSLRPFYYVPIALGLAWLGWRVAILTSVLSTGVWLLSDFLAGSNYVSRPSVFWNAAITITTFLIIVGTLHTLLALYRDMDQRVRERTASLEEALAARERLQREILETASRERNAIGRDLHDGLCQHLTGTALAAQVLAERLTSRGEPVAGDARTVVGLIQESITQTRTLAAGLLLTTIEPERLGEELSDFAALTTRQGGVPCRCEITGQPSVADSATATQLLRIAQEAVRNAVRHAQASQITITLAVHDQTLQLSVADNGRGLPPPTERRRGLGLEIMAHRAASIGAEIALENPSAGGTRVSCRLAVQPATHVNRT